MTTLTFVPIQDVEILDGLHSLEERLRSWWTVTAEAVVVTVGGGPGDPRTRYLVLGGEAFRRFGRAGGIPEVPHALSPSVRPSDTVLGPSVVVDGGQVTGVLVLAEHGRDRTRTRGARAPERREALESEVVRRTPHAELSKDCPAPGTQFSVTVWADLFAPLPGEESQMVEIDEDPSLRNLALHVWLDTSDNLSVASPGARVLVIARDRMRSTEVVFPVAVENDTPPGSAAWVTALFSYRGRPCGHVRRLLKIGDAGALHPSGSLESPAPRQPAAVLKVSTAASRPDLTVEIVAGPDNDGRRFTCRVSATAVPEGDDSGGVPWHLPDVSPRLVTDYLDAFTKGGISNKQRTALLRGAGMRLFDAAPANFKSLLWRLIDSGNPPRSILVVSQEPHMPWELMVPHRRRPDGSPEEPRQALGVEFSVGRWLTETHLSPEQSATYPDSSVVVAPKYQGSRALPKSQDEAGLLIRLLHARQVTPALYEEMAEMFGTEGIDLVHFVGHGLTGAVQVIELENDDTLSSLALGGMSGTEAFRRSTPIVFLNACEVGRTEPSLIGVDGFARALIDMGARVVIAPLWSVKDDVAHDVAERFYTSATADPTASLAEVLRNIRALAYAAEGGEDTYAAYSFYGDPLSTLSAPKA